MKKLTLDVGFKETWVKEEKQNSCAQLRWFGLEKMGKERLVRSCIERMRLVTEGASSVDQRGDG